MRSKEPKRPEEPIAFAEAVRELAGFSATIIGLLYVFGLFIVNIDLGRAGIVASDLASPQYVVVGSVWAVLLTGIGLPLFFAVNLTRTSSSEMSFARAIEMFAAWVVTILWWVALMTFFNIINPRNLHRIEAFLPVADLSSRLLFSA